MILRGRAPHSTARSPGTTSPSWPPRRACPLLAKGVLDPDDARLAVEAGSPGIVVSNHGARQLDTVLPTAAALPAIAEATGGAIDVLVDGGIRRGTDAVKALALGASGVLVGRQMLWALACGGAPAATRGMEMLVEEFGTALAIMGYTRASDLDRSALLPAPWASWDTNDSHHDRPGRDPNERQRRQADRRRPGRDQRALRASTRGPATRATSRATSRSSPSDGLFDGVSGYYDGHAGLRRLAEEIKIGPRSRGLQHWVGNSIFEGTTERCVVKSMCFAPSRIENEHSIVFVGYYVDTCVKLDGEWKFEIRRWRPWAGQVVDGARPWETGADDGGFIHTQGQGSTRPSL